MHADTFRTSPQTRAMHPAPDDGELHDRARKLGETMRDIFALGQGVGFKDLIGAGYTSAEILEHHTAAQAYANELSTRRIAPSPDRLADMVAKARVPMPNKLPLPEGTSETQALFVAWGQYCAARAALLSDPWPGQRERCAEQLMLYLQRLPLPERDRKTIRRAVGETLNNIGTRTGAGN